MKNIFVVTIIKNDVMQDQQAWIDEKLPSMQEMLHKIPSLPAFDYEGVKKQIEKAMPGNGTCCPKIVTPIYPKSGGTVFINIFPGPKVVPPVPPVVVPPVPPVVVPPVPPVVVPPVKP